MSLCDWFLLFSDCVVLSVSEVKIAVKDKNFTTLLTLWTNLVTDDAMEVFIDNLSPIWREEKLRALIFLDVLIN